MTSAFYSAGFEVYDVHINDLINKSVNLDMFRGIAFVGGFSYAVCVLGVCSPCRMSWSLPRVGPVLFSTTLSSRSSSIASTTARTPSLLVFATVVSWWLTSTTFPSTVFLKRSSLGKSCVLGESWSRFIHNKSGRFESRFVNIRFEKSNSIFFKGMEGSVLGVWVAHGEGQCYWPDQQVKQDALDHNCVVARYVDDNGEVCWALVSSCVAYYGVSSQS